MPTNDGEGFSVSAVFKRFRKGVWGWGGGPLMMEDFLFLQIKNVLIRNRESNCFSWWNCGLFQDTVGSDMIYSYQGAPQTTSLKCFFCYLMAVEPFLSQVFVD